MPDVGILNLQIHDNSSTAAEGLGRLAAKLKEMKEAAAGVKLGTVATGIKRINDELKNVQPSAIFKLKQLADVLEKIGSISGNVGGIRISFGGRGQNAEDMAAQMQAARDAVAQTTAGFEQMKSAAQEVAAQDEAIARGTENIQTAVQDLDFTKFDPSRLPLGALGMKLDDSAREVYQWGSVVKDTFEDVQQIKSEDLVRAFRDAEETIQQTAASAESVSAAAQETTEIASSIQQIADSSEKINSTASAFENVSNSVQEAKIEVQAYYASLEDAFNGIRRGQKIDGSLMSEWLHGEGTSNEQLYAIKTLATDFGMTVDEVKQKISELLMSEQMAAQSGAIDDVGSGLEGVAGGAEEASRSIKELIIGSDSLSGSMKRMFPTISGLLSRFKQLVKYRMLRAVIKQIAEGFREGYENYYHYSEAIGSGFAPAMDDAATALLQMKNSIGAAMAPLLQSLVPVLQTVVNWFITLINYANQFLALLNGQVTWSRALPYATQAITDQTKKTKAASNAMKDLLADWDELNIIQSKSGHGGGGSSTTAAAEYANMFEEVTEYDENIKALVDGINEHFGGILELAKRIGVAILGWKLATAFGGMLGTLGALIATGAIIDLEFNISKIMNDNYLKTGKEGWLIGDILTTLIGGVLMKKVLTKVLGAKAASVAIPLTLAVTAIAGITTLLGNNDVSALSKEALIDSAYNALKIGGVGGYLLHSAGYGMGASIGGGAGLAVTTMGIIIGLKAIAETADTGEITKETIKENFLSAGLVGGGLMIGEAVLGGTAGTVLAVGGVGAIAVLAALFTIQALLTLKEEDPVKWGNYKATEEEIRGFVNEEVFSAAPKVEIDLANATFKELGENKEKLENAASKALGTLNAVKLGLKTTAETDLRTELKEFISAFDSTSETYQDALKVAVSLVPVSGGKDESTDLVNRSESRWSELNGIMVKLADELANDFDIAYNDKLDETTKKNAQVAIEKITAMMTQITEAISSGEIKARAVNSLNTQISNMSQSNMGDLIAYYKQQRDTMIEEMIKANEDAAEGTLASYYTYQRLAEYALDAANGNIEDATYKHYLAQAQAAFDDYTKLIENIRVRAETEANKTLQETSGAQKIKETLLNNIVRGIIGVDVSEAIMHYSGLIGANSDTFSETFMSLLFNGDSLSENARQYMRDFLDSIISEAYGNNSPEYIEAVHSGILTYSDLINEDVMSLIASKLGIDGGKLQEILNELFPPTVEIPTSEVKHETVVEETVSVVQDETPVGDTAATPIIEETQKNFNTIQNKAEETQAVVNSIVLDDMKFDTTGAVNSANNAATAIEEMASRIRTAFESLNGMSFSFTADNQVLNGIITTVIPQIQPMASGGYIRSGDLVMANENGSIEMMGRMGNQPVVANNEQIVTGITRGVASGNDNVVSALNTLINLAVRIERKEMVARVSPSSGLGRTNSQSADMYNTVTGY